MKATASRVGLNCAALALAMIGMICPTQTAKSAATAVNDTYKMKQVQVIDRAGLGQPTPAADLLIPTDWKFESNVQWENRRGFTDLAAITFRAQSPNGRLVIEAFPSFSWQWASDPAVQKYLVMENRQGAQSSFCRFVHCVSAPLFGLLTSMWIVAPSLAPTDSKSSRAQNGPTPDRRFSRPSS